MKQEIAQGEKFYPKLADHHFYDEGKIIDFFDNAEGYIVPTQENVLDIDRYFFEKSQYLYKVVVETIMKYDVVGFDAGAYIFFSKDKIFPKQTSIQRWLDTVQPITKDQLSQFKALPANKNKLVDFSDEWLVQHENVLGFSETEKRISIIRGLVYIGILVKMYMNKFS